MRRVSGNVAGKIWKEIQHHTEKCAIKDVYVKQRKNTGLILPSQKPSQK